jgi:hypothetical protein
MRTAHFSRVSAAVWAIGSAMNALLWDTENPQLGQGLSVFQADSRNALKCSCRTFGGLVIALDR